MEKIEYRYRFWYWYRPKFMVSDWYRIETKKAGIAHHYAMVICSGVASLDKWGGGDIFIYSCSQTVKTIDFNSLTPNAPVCAQGLTSG